MCIYCLITCKCIGQFYYIRGNPFCSIRTLSCYLYKSWGCGDNFGVMYEMYVHIVAVAYVTFSNK